MSVDKGDGMAPPPSYVDSVQEMADRTFVRVAHTPLADKSGTFVQLESLTQFRDNVRTPIDLIAVLDVSGSMNSKVTGALESNGYTRFDLLKHAMNVIIGNLSQGDSLTIITFGNDARVVMHRATMSAANAKEAKRLLDAIDCDGRTNLYDGLKTAYSYVRNRPLSQTAEQFINRHIMVLTDGAPNADMPAASIGTVSELQTYTHMMDRVFHESPVCHRTLLHVFGLCHDELDDRLLSGIAQHGHGMYGFISDPAILTQCFINILAVWFSMFATGLTLRMGVSAPEDQATEVFVPWILQKGNVDVKLSFTMKPEQDIYVQLISNTSRSMRVMVIEVDTKIAQNHFLLRQRVAQMLHTACDTQKGRGSSSALEDTVRASLACIATAKGGDSVHEEWLAALQKDVDVYSRIKHESLTLWARHCLHSLAVSLQDDYISNGYEQSYKVRAGPRLLHWVESIEQVAKNIALPHPSFQAYEGDGGRRNGSAPQHYGYQPPPPPPRYQAQSYFSSGYGRDYDDGCIHGDCVVSMADGSTKLVKDIKIGDHVQTDGATKVGTIRCSFLVPTSHYVELPDGLRLTHMHPVWCNDRNTWILPTQHPGHLAITSPESIDMYSFLLEKSVDESCAMIINGHRVVHFAHDSQDEVLKHPFYGTDRIRATAERLDPKRTGRIRVTRALRNTSGDVYEYEGVTF